MCVYFCKKKLCKNKTETNKNGYLKGEGRN